MPVQPPSDKPSQHLWFRFDALPVDAVKDLAATGVIKGVSLIKIGPALGHTGWAEDGTPCQVMVDAETLNQTKLLAEQFANGLKSRSAHYTEVLDTVGYFNNFVIDGGALRADYNLFDTHAGYAHLVKLCQTLWDQFGLSIDFLGTLVFDQANRIAFARIEELFAADLTPEPAANAQGLYARGGNSTRVEKPAAWAITFDKIEKTKPQGTKNNYMKSVSAILLSLAAVFAPASVIAFRAPGRRFDEAAPKVELAAEPAVADLAADIAELITFVTALDGKVKAILDAEAAKVSASAIAAAAAAAASGAAPAGAAAPGAASAVTNPTALSEIQALQAEFSSKIASIGAKHNIALAASAGAPAVTGLPPSDEPAVGSPEAIKKEYAALTDPAKKLAFRKKHREVLFS